ncbi:MAG TPA: hypothetical protein VHW44_03910 [Pseudonocardiaceae bacterium]|jgi:hypothetical protein|nr:hypothetical protein [Pseudonocardiaceae bacterium]
MLISAPIAQLIDTARGQAGALLNRVRGEAGEHLAQLSGRTAGWADEAGDAVAVITDAAAVTAGQVSRDAVDAADRYAERTRDRVTRLSYRWTENLGDHLVRLGGARSGK